MAIISSFLCWSNTRTGSAVCGYYTLVISVVCLAFYMLRYIALDEMRDSIELKGIVYAGFVLYSVLIGVSLVLLPGVYMDRKFLLLPWIYVLVITVLYETGAIALITTVHLEKEHDLDPWEIVAVAFYCVRLLANCYCFACVVSQYQELTEGRGTYEFIFKPWRRQMARSAHLPDFEEYNPPYGATLPPYSEDNPYKEFSPPTYENLRIDLESARTPVVTQHNSRNDNPNLPLSLYLADVEVNSPPPGMDNLSLTGSDVGNCVDYGDFQYPMDQLNSFSDFSNDTLSSSVSPEHSRSSSLASDYTPPHEESKSRQHHRHHRRSHEDSGISMTSLSGHFPEYSETKNFRHKRRPISPLTVHKRTYITWI
ncbi:uncharacterized protein LOC131942053 [Physella acuta]|uniref:uncharacterized protein LOC131942053 n=1 Tax=Physella acuta TaxID=109671 RepID=UPI0027DCD3D9|nr:uncharacterized protein LOC131942053 [Physella acuta]